MYIYGVNFNKFESDYVTEGVRTDDAYNLKFKACTGIEHGIDDFKLGPFNVKECITRYDYETKKHQILAYKGQVKKSNYAALLADPGNNVMIEFPKFYYLRSSRYSFKVSNTQHENFLISPMHENSDYVYVSKYKVNSQFRSVLNSKPLTSVKLADFKNGLINEGLSVINYNIIASLTMLMLVKYANLDIQSVIGAGIHDDSIITNNGATNNLASFDGRVLTAINESSSVVTLGIENWYGNLFSFVDNIKKDEYGYIWLNNQKMKEPTVNCCGYVSELVYDTKYPFLLYPTQVTTHVNNSLRDYVYSDQYSKGLVLMNGSWKGNDRTGIFSFDIMSRVSFKDKYVGAFAYFDSKTVTN